MILLGYRLLSLFFFFSANTKKGTLFKQMPREERFELSRDDPLVVFCSNRWCGKLQQKGERFNNCGKCRLSYYCSPACQKVDWRKGKHKQTCAPMTPKPKLVRNFSMDWTLYRTLANTNILTCKSLIIVQSNFLEGLKTYL